jgi:predicted glutamine amidotransferase
MCRWLAYQGSPIALDEFIFNTQHSLIDQSMSATMGPHTTNGDGFGMGWYGRDGDPGIYRGVQPAWNDANLRDIAHHMESSLFLAHVRRSTGTAVQQTNCHPFRCGKWMFVHNGLIYGYADMRRDLILHIKPELFPEIRGSADSELMFFLALSYGLEKDPIGAMEKTVGLIEEIGRAQGVEHPMQMTVGVANGETLWAIRYSTQGDSRTLFYNTAVAQLRELYPDHPKFHLVPDNARAICSEPLSDLSGVWNVVPESTALVVKDGEIELKPFAPSPP